MGVNCLNKISVKLLSIIAVIGLLIGLSPVAYAEESEQSWPKIKAPDGLTLNSAYEAATNNITAPVYSSMDAKAPQTQKVPFTITVTNNDDGPKEIMEGMYKNGTIELNYGDLLVAMPSSNYMWEASYYDLEIEGPGTKYPASIMLTAGKAQNAPMVQLTTDSSIIYVYDINVGGNNLIANYPSNWSYDAATNTLTINSQKYISDYKSYSLTNRLIPTWGTTMNTETIDFSQGPGKVTLTNLLGKSEEYTIKLVMPWQLSVPGKSGYNIVSIIVDGIKIAGESDMEPLVGSETYEVISGKKVELTIEPYGENEGKVIDTISFLDGNYNEIEVEGKTVNGNTVSFTMPLNNLRVGEIKYKVADSPVFSIKTTSTEYRDGLEMGTISTNVGGRDASIACAGELITVTASPINHGVYDFGFSHWETEDIELSDNQKTNESISFNMPGNSIKLLAVFEKKGVEVSFVADPGDAVSTFRTFSVSNDTKVSSIISQNGVPATDIYKPGSKISFILGAIGSAYLFDEYSVKDQNGNTIPYEIGNWRSVIFTIPETGVTSINVVAKFKAKEFSSITAKPNDASMGTVTASVNGSAITAAVLQDETVTLKAEPLSRYKFVSWDIAYEDGSSVDFEISDRTSNPATFVVPDNGKGIIVTGIFELDPEQMSTECDMLSVALFDGDTRYIAAKEGTAYTITVPKGTDPAALSAMVLKLTASEYATIRKSGDTQDWPAEGKACGMVVNTPVIFTVTAEDGKTSQDYTVTITETKSSEKEITAVRLLDSSNNSIAEGVLSGDTWTITLPADIDPTLASGIGSSTDVYMQIEYTGASVAQAGGYDDAGQTSWNTGTILCGVSVNSQKTFTVKAEDGSTRDYVIAISYTAPDAPTLTNGSAERTGERTAVVKFTSSQSGTYYYQVVEKGASANVDTSKNGSTAVAGENTINLSNLTADARDIYIVVKNAAGAESIPYKIEISAYSSQDPEPGSYRITVSTPKGGTLTTNVTTANKGDSIIVTVTPDSGYQMVEGSLTYTMAVAGGETVKINGNRFQMPECDVTITCQWEESSSGGGDDTTQEPGITGFVVQGVAGAISQNSDTQFTISVLLPHGSDVTKLAPIISTYGNVNVSPASGKVLDFSSPVTYTVTLEDGTKLQYKVTVYVSAGSKADQMWDKLADPHNQIFWWDYALQQQIRGKYPKYW